MNSDVSEGRISDQALLDQKIASESFLDHAIWNNMQSADSINLFSKFWLELQCCQIEAIVNAMVIFAEDDEPETDYAIANYWPEGSQGSLGLTAVCDLVFSQKRGVVRQAGQKKVSQGNPDEMCHVGFPFLIDGRVVGVVAVELVTEAETILRTTMRQLQWGANWVENFYKRQSKYNLSADDGRLSLVLELLGSCIENQHFHAAATTITTELCSMLDCERVTVGFLKGNQIKVKAMSHSAQVNNKSNIVDLINAAMDESFDQLTTLVYPASDTSMYINNAQAKLSGSTNKAICTVPLTQNADVLGALTLERSENKPFDAATVELCELVASLLGPVLDSKRKDDQWLGRKIWVSFRQFIISLLGRGHIVLKLVTLLLCSLAIFFTVAEGDYRVSSDAKLEGVIQRVITAPIDGFISEANIRAGDIVRKGDILAKLDDKDLVLERLNWVSKKNQFLKQYRDALAKFNRAEIRVLKAKLGQTEAELALLDEQLSRIRLVSPFDGLVVSGDLSQLMGSPVATGDQLFEVAPLNLYRVVLEVDERDIRAVNILQSGELVLTGKADKVLSFKVTKLTPVAEQQEGRNYFRVEAVLDEKPVFLRPGMKGVGKIDIGRRKLIWIWTHNLVDWARLWLWNWWF